MAIRAPDGANKLRDIHETELFMLGFENLTIISKLHLSEMNNVESGFTHQLVDFTPS